MGKTRDLFKKLRDTKGTFHAKVGMMKDRHGKDITEAKRDKKAFLSDQCKEIEESNRMGKLEISSRNSEIPREHFMQRWAQ